MLAIGVHLALKERESEESDRQTRIAQFNSTQR